MERCFALLLCLLLAVTRGEAYVGGGSARYGPDDSDLPTKIITHPESVETRLGSRVVLPCRAQNPQGAIVQWTQGGFGLGDQRSLPGFDRYRIIGQDKERELMLLGCFIAG